MVIFERMKPIRCALYHRVSTIDQHASNARDELRAAAKRYGYEIALDVEETGSGGRNDRPGLQRVLEAAGRGKVEAVLVWALDRFGRSASDLLTNIQRLSDNGVRFIAVSQGLDIKPQGEPISKLLLTMLAGVAEFERSLIRERTMLGLEAARRSGRHLGRPLSNDAPDGSNVVSMRCQGLSWRVIGARLGCGEWAARRAAKRVKNGPVEAEAVKQGAA